MKKQDEEKKMNSSKLSTFKQFEVNSLRSIVGGGTDPKDGGVIDPPIVSGTDRPR